MLLLASALFRPKRNYLPVGSLLRIAAEFVVHQREVLRFPAGPVDRDRMLVRVRRLSQFVQMPVRVAEIAVGLAESALKLIAS